MEKLNALLETATNNLTGHPIIGPAIGLVLLAVVALIADQIAKRQLVRLLRALASRTRSTWDDALIRHRVFARFAHCAPALVVYTGAAWVTGLPAAALQLIENIALAYIALTIVMGLGAALTAVNDIYEQYPVSRNRPIKGYLQVGKIILYCIGAILIISALIDESPLLLLSGFGAMTAVLMLVFRDTILSLVASIQLVSNDMVRVGDWIEMPRYDADGDVIDVALHTITVQNWDKTVTTIPTHSLISESFRNWRGMSESGGRRIKRALLLDMNSIRFLTDEETDRFRRFALLNDYIQSKQHELSTDNTGLINDDKSATVNMRRLTNVGTFRAYIRSYLRGRNDISDTLTFLVRQLTPTADGLPIEIYIFTNSTEWITYEGIQSDIFDHLLAIVPEFGLRVYQRPSGMDVRTLAPMERQPRAARD
jgi:miniconductance mechanosensitive channel